MDFSNTQNVDVRASMLPVGRTLPTPLYNFVQRILTWITGKALPGHRPIMGGLSPCVHLSGMLFMLIGSATISVSLWTVGGAYLILFPVTAGLTLSASRTLWLMDLHAAAHGSFSKKRWVNKLVGDMVSLLMMVLPHSDYRRSHCVDHHSPRTFCSPDDPDGSFLYWMGLTPGTSKQDLWHRLLLGLLSPRVHTVFLVARLKANLLSSGWRRSLVSLLYLALLVYLAAHFGWTAIFMSWLLPIGLFYQVSAIVGWAGEHAWFAPKTGDLEDWHNARTHARFFGVRFPQTGSKAQRLWWAVQMVGELILRSLFVPGDLPNHDWHHRHPASRDWTWAAYARQSTIEAGESYSLETWGLVMAIDHGLSSIAAQTPSDQRRSSTSDAMTVFGAM